MTDPRLLTDDEIASASGAFACYYPLPFEPWWPFPPTFPEPLYY